MSRARDRRRAWAVAFAVCLVASQALVWLAYYGWGAKPLIGDEESYRAFALAILGGGSWMPSTIWPPLQAILIAAIYAVTGPHVLAVQLVQTVLMFACALLLRAFWRRVDGRVAAANLAAALFILDPATAAYAQWLWPEPLHLVLVLAAFCLLAMPPSRWRALGAGAAIGGALLAKSLLTAFWPAFLVVYARAKPPRFLLAPAALFVTGLLVVTAPALRHGMAAYGRPTIADSSVYNLWIGLTDDRRSDYVADMGGATLPAFLASGDTPAERNEIYLAKVRALVAAKGIARTLSDQLSRQYFRLFSAKTSLVSQLPGPACAGHLSVYRTRPWMTRTLTLANDAFHVLILAGAAFGVACWRRRPDRLVVLVALYCAYQLALLLFVHVKARFLLPMLPFLAGFAGSFIVAAARRLRGDGAPRDFEIVPIATTPIGLATGTALAALLVFLAFAGPVLDGACAG